MSDSYRQAEEELLTVQKHATLQNRQMEWALAAGLLNLKDAIQEEFEDVRQRLERLQFQIDQMR